MDVKAPGGDGEPVGESPSPAAPGRELRVLHIFSTLGVGGAETWLIALLRYFRENERTLPFRVTMDVCLTGGAPGQLDGEARALGANLFYLQYSKSRLGPFTREFRGLLKRGRYDVIHDHQEHTAGLHFFLGAGALPRVRVVHFHNPPVMRSRDYAGWGGQLVSTAGYFFVRRLATHLLGTSLQNLVEQRMDKDHVPDRIYSGPVHCGFETEEFTGDRQLARRELRGELGFDDSAAVLLFVGRLHTDAALNQKNPGFALEAAAACMTLDPRVCMVFAGSGASGERELRERAAQLGLSERVRFLGLRSDVPRLMLGSDALLFPSFAEGLGMVAVEAQAAGLRVFASDVVPRECVVVPELVTFLPLSAGALRWAQEIAKALAVPPPDHAECNLAVRYSEFSIEASATRLLDIYSGNTKPS